MIPKAVCQCPQGLKGWRLNVVVQTSARRMTDDETRRRADDVAGTPRPRPGTLGSNQEPLKRRVPRREAQGRDASRDRGGVDVSNTLPKVPSGSRAVPWGHRARPGLEESQSGGDRRSMPTSRSAPYCGIPRAWGHREARRVDGRGSSGDRDFLEAAQYWPTSRLTCFPAFSGRGERFPH